MAARSDNLGGWVCVERGLIEESGYIGRSVETPSPELHPDTCMESTKERNESPVSTRVRHDHKLRKRKPSSFVNKLPSTEAILQHLVLLRGEVGELRDQFRELECACALLAQATEQRENNTACSLTDTLTRRQRVALKLIARGSCIKQVAQKMKITPKTAQYFWSQIRAKLRVTNYVQAASIARLCGLI